MLLTKVTLKDYGGVHINSGIPNKAFYLVATGLGGNAWEKAGMIWYITLREKLQASSDFVDAAQGTIATSGQLFGMGSTEQEIVRNAWASVGISISEDDVGQDGCWTKIKRSLGM